MISIRAWRTPPATGLLVALIAGAGCGTGNQYVPPPPAEVTVSRPLRRGVMSYLEYTGTTKSVETVELRARVKGFLEQRLFREGEDVTKGQLLLVIDERPFKVNLDLAKAKLNAAEAGVKKAEESKAKQVAKAKLDLDMSILQLARIEASRQRALIRRNASSQEEVDKAEAELKKSEAQVESDRASLEQATADYVTDLMAAKAAVSQSEADIHNVQLELGYCRISAPFDGRISRAYFDVGNLVGDGQSTVLATIVKFDPIYAYMSVSETDLLLYRKLVREGKRVDFRKEVIPLDLALANEKGFPHRGKIDYVDPSVDPGSGTIQARGLFPNPGSGIYPGLFCRVRVPLVQRPDAILVPQLALAYDQGGWYVLVVGPGNKVEQRYVTPGAAEGPLRVIEDRLEAQDRVVVSGLQRARPGVIVNPKEEGSHEGDKLIVPSSSQPQHLAPSSPESSPAINGPHPSEPDTEPKRPGT